MKSEVSMKRSHKCLLFKPYRRSTCSNTTIYAKSKKLFTVFMHGRLKNWGHTVQAAGLPPIMGSWSALATAGARSVHSLRVSLNKFQWSENQGLLIYEVQQPLEQFLGYNPGGWGGEEDFCAAQGPADWGGGHGGVHCCTSHLLMYTILLTVAIQLSQDCTVGWTNTPQKKKWF